MNMDIIFFPFYIANWYKATRAMTLLEKAAYLELLCYYYSTNGNRLPIEDTDTLFVIACTRGPEDEKAVLKIVKTMFIDGKHIGADEEMEKILNLRRKKSEGGKNKGKKLQE